MFHRHGRRELLRTAGWLLGSRLGARAAGASGAWLLSCTRSHAAPGSALGPPQPFSFEQMIEQARASAQRPYQPPYRPAPELVSKIDYEVHGKLRFKTARALFAERGPYPVTFFHLGQFFPSSVK